MFRTLFTVLLLLPAFGVAQETVTTTMSSWFSISVGLVSYGASTTVTTTETVPTDAQESADQAESSEGDDHEAGECPVDEGDTGDEADAS